MPNGLTYIGTINELALDFYTYTEWFMDDWTDPSKPVNLPAIPGGTLMMASTEAEFSMNYGAVTLVDKDTENFYTEEGIEVPDSWIKKRPPSRSIALYSRPLPTPNEVDSWFVAEVL